MFDFLMGASSNGIQKLENKLIDGSLNESQALRLLQFYNSSGMSDELKKALERILVCNNLRTSKIIAFALQHHLQKRDYHNAYRYAKDLCYYHDRYGKSLLELSKIAILKSQYNLAANWLYEYIAHNTANLDIAKYWLGTCFLRQRDFQKAINCLSDNDNPLASTDLMSWLYAITDGKRNTHNINWFGRKAAPMGRLAKLDWKTNVINSSLSFQARNLSDIDAWINKGKYVSDERLYGEADKWQIPSVFEKIRAGDCEDFALWTWVQLLRMNNNARFMLGGLYSDELNHAWVCIYGRSSIKILECTPSEFNIPIDAKNAPEYLPILSLDKSLTWYNHE